MKNQNTVLQETIKTTVKDNETFKSELKVLDSNNSQLKEQYEELNLRVVNLQTAEEELKTAVASLSAKLEDNSDEALNGVIDKIEKLHKTTRKELDEIVEKIKSLETNLKQSPKYGIFSYLAEKDQPIFIRAVDNAVAEEKTFAKINEHLSNNLPPELDKIIKEHPSLAKTYIKNFKKD